MADDLNLISPELQMLRNNKIGGYNYRQRRHAEWDENYELSRDRVTYNRLTQRQSVSLPVMKMMQRTLLANIDDMPVLYFENLDNNKDAEIFKNEYWKYTETENNMKIQDIVDKKQVFNFGRTYDQWQIIDGKVVMNVQDPMDIEVSRMTSPYDIHSSDFLIHNHIFQTLSSLEADPELDQTEVAKLKDFFGTAQGLIKSATNLQMLQERNQKMSDMGVLDIEQPILGETYVEMSLHFVKRQEKEDEERQIYLYVECEDMHILSKKRLEDVIGVTKDHFFRTHYPYCSWADDVERQDWYSDSIADTIRTPAKIVNTYFSQDVENRTMRGFGMMYHAQVEGWNPQTWNPQAWGWYGVPLGEGQKIDDIIKSVEIPALDGNIDSINFILGVLEKATGATATLQGAATENKITLGEVQLALGQAKQRIKGMAKFYTKAWEDRGLMFVKMLEAAGDKIDAVKLYKKGRNTDSVYSRLVGPSDWKSEAGWRCKVWSQDDKNEQDQMSLQKLDAVKMNMPDNPRLAEIYQRKLLEFAGLDPDQIKDIMDYETQKRAAMLSASGGVPGAMPMAPMGQGQPALPPPQQQRPMMVH